MTYLLLQTFLLLLASYFLGAFIACTVKRMIVGERYEAPAHIAVPVTVDAPLRPPIATVAPQPVRARTVPPPVVPRSIDPVQPKIDVLRRPEPYPVPKLVDPSRFERALMGPDPNEGMPRRAIPEIRPAVLNPVTGAYYPGTYGPPPEPEPPPPVVELTPVERAPAPPMQEAPLQSGVGTEVVHSRETVAEVEPVKRTSLSDATTSAAASAVAAAKAAAAASIVPMLRTLTPRSSRPSLMEKLSLSQDKEQVEEKSVEDEIIEEKHIDEQPFAPEQVEDEEPLEDDQIEDTSEEDELQLEPEIEEEDIAAPLPEAIPEPVILAPIEGGDDFQRIRAIDSQLEQRLKAEGIDSFEHIATWSNADVQRVSQKLGIPGRIDREQWVEQAQILAKGGETYYSRNRLAALKAASPAPKPEIAEALESQPVQSSEQPSEDLTSPVETANNSANLETVSEQVSSASEPSAQLSGVAAVSQVRSVAEMAAAAAAAIAAASASVTRGLKPIEPISPLSKVDPKISIPAKLSDAIKEKEAASAPVVAPAEAQPPRPMSAASQGPSDDLKRIRGVGVLIEKRLNAMGISRYDQIANWTSGDIDRVSQMLEFKGRIEREGWVEQARILLNGGHTEFSRRVDRGEVDTSRET